ncbi:molybdate ABC transporter substrate-binding protein [Kribbia dieselivorans]|uniref:molybdate ABC transporter substrate-binding protein n=1 Tax=Kribbia dieselivorans TaxID=331526 RepID=UPI0009F8FBA9|nr:molybdate ABC transporter substrate-binding protein [Kribbia dieselivorans]
MNSQSDKRVSVRTARAAAGAALLAVIAGACGVSTTDTTPEPSSGGYGGNITVLAAASLTETFTQIGKTFEADNPNAKVTFSFAASSALAEQIDSGAPADVFASASTKNMDTVVQAGHAADPTVFATNVLTIAVPAANPGKVTGLDSLTSRNVKTALCQPQVPCGVVAAEVATNAKVDITPVTLEPDVKSVLSKVTLGEVDAGLVYVTDARAAGDKVREIAIPAKFNASTDYPIATLKDSQNTDTAQGFVDAVLSDEGQKVLTEAGFGTP